MKYRDISKRTNGRIGRTLVVKHKINIGDARSIYQIKYIEGCFKRKQRNPWVRWNEKEPSSTPWVSLIMLMEKKNRTIKFSMDYRQLNNVTKKKNSYSQSWINNTECFNLN